MLLQHHNLVWVARGKNKADLVGRYGMFASVARGNDRSLWSAVVWCDSSRKRWFRRRCAAKSAAECLVLNSRRVAECIT